MHLAQTSMPDIATIILKPLKCRGCGREAAQTDALDLYFSGSKVPLSPLEIAFPCSHCGRRIEWTSSRKGKVIAKPQRMV
jgi:hypothetical protein